MLRSDLRTHGEWIAEARVHPPEWAVLVLDTPDYPALVRELGDVDLGRGLARVAAIGGPLVLPIRSRSGDPTRITLGRDPDADVVLFAETVSKWHAELAYLSPAEDPRVVLTDLGSKNGTKVDRAPLAPHRPLELSARCAIKLGAMRLRFLSAGAFAAELERSRPRATLVAAEGAPRVQPRDFS